MHAGQVAVVQCVALGGAWAGGATRQGSCQCQMPGESRRVLGWRVLLACPCLLSPLLLLWVAHVCCCVRVWMGVLGGSQRGVVAPE